VNSFASFEKKIFFPSFRFKAKITKSKQSEKFKAKKTKKIDPISLYFAYKQNKFLSETGAP
jgi:hypothetical protein